MLGKCVLWVSGIVSKQIEKVDHYNGYDFFMLREDIKKNYEYGMFFLEYDNHYFHISNNRERIKEYLDHNPNFNIQQWITKSFEESLITGSRVSKGLAQYLNREEEALQAVERFRKQKEQEKVQREDEKAERERQFQLEYEKKLTDAETEFMDNKKIDSDMFLALCDKYYVTVPIRTRGWIKSSLADISIDKEGWTRYRYSGNKSSKIHEIAKQLLNALKDNNNLNVVTLDELNQLFGQTV